MFPRSLSCADGFLFEWTERTTLCSLDCSTVLDTVHSRYLDQPPFPVIDRLHHGRDRLWSLCRGATRLLKGRQNRAWSFGTNPYRMGFFQRPFIALRALSCAWSPPATICFKCRSWALITSSAVLPDSEKSHGPPSCLHVMVFMDSVPFVVLVAGRSRLHRSCPSYDRPPCSTRSDVGSHVHA